MKVKIFNLIICFFLFGTSANLLAVDVNSGKVKSQSCAACHGPEGVSFNDHWPNLAGQKSAYLIQQLKSFRDGRRYDPWMSPMAKTLTDQDIEDLVVFYSQL